VRVTIEATDSGSPKALSIEISGDAWDLPVVMADLIQPALLGWGFHQDDLVEYLEPSMGDLDE